MIQYSDFEEYVREEVIRDRTFFSASNNHFLRIANQALLEFARDLNTIDSDYYYEDSSVSMEEGAEVNLGQSLGYAGAWFKPSNSFMGEAKPVPRLKKGNHKTAYGIRDWYNDQGDLIVQFVNNNSMPMHLDTSNIILMYSRKPNKLTGVEAQPLDIPEQGLYPLAMLCKYYYYLFREFYEEADRVALEYRGYMNKYIKKGKPAIMGTSLGKQFISNSSSVMTFR